MAKAKVRPDYEHRRKYFADWHQKNKGRRMPMLRARKKRARREAKTFLDEIKRGPCTDCRQCFPICVMQFDHRMQYNAA